MTATLQVSAIKSPSLNLTAMVCNFDAVRSSYSIEITNLDDLNFASYQDRAISPASTGVIGSENHKSEFINLTS